MPRLFSYSVLILTKTIKVERFNRLGEIMDDVDCAGVTSVNPHFFADNNLIRKRLQDFRCNFFKIAVSFYDSRKLFYVPVSVILLLALRRFCTILKVPRYVTGVRFRHAVMFASR